MNGPGTPLPAADRSDADLELDLEVALRIEGYRWMEWNAEGLGEAPLYERGRFVAHPGDVFAHYYVEADCTAPLAEQPYRRLPHYSSDADLALRAAERVGLFAGDGVCLSSSSSGVWRLDRRDGSSSLTDDSLPRLVCRASLRWIEGSRQDEDR